MKTKSKRTVRRVGSGRLVLRLFRIVTEGGKFPYKTQTRCLDVVEHVFDGYRRMCTNLQNLVQKHDIGDPGVPVDEIVCEEMTRLYRAWGSDQRLFRGALQLLKEAGCPPNSQDLIDAADRFDEQNKE